MASSSKYTIITCLGMVMVLAALTNCRDGHQEVTPVVTKMADTDQKAPSYETIRPILMETCVSCHQMNGKLDWSDKTIAVKNKQSILNRIWSMRESPLGMPQLNSVEAAALSEEDRLKLKAWAESAEPGTEISDNIESGEESLGELPSRDPIKEISLYDKVAGSCFGCHGKNGIGGIPFAPYLAGLDKVYLVGQLNAFKSFEVGKVGSGRHSPFMNDIAKSMSDEEIEFAADYYSKRDVESLMREAFRERKFTDEEKVLIARGQSYVAKGDGNCAGCHVGPRGRSITPGIPSLAGQKATVIQKELNDFVSKYRKPGWMIGALDQLVIRETEYQEASSGERVLIHEADKFRFNDDHIKAISLYFSALIPGVPMEDQPNIPKQIIK